ncbi:hypothetical protein [Moraxella oblonga]|uniref:hypothetical protein n=1 Tax=Moraxella oblonga TaxID=200413 RepID=UPI00082CB57B|nr:hypothetical protein [Moraxella oblonga]
MTDFKFKDKTFNFPIFVYRNHHFNKKTQVIFIIIMVIGFIITTLFALMIEKYWGMMVYLFLVIAFYVTVLMSKNPLMVIYPQKVVFKNFGIGKPKTLDWQDCQLEIATLKRDFGEIPLLNFLSKRNDGKMERIFYVVLNNIRFENEHFDKNNSLKFFEKIKALSENP